MIISGKPPQISDSESPLWNQRLWIQCSSGLSRTVIRYPHAHFYVDILCRPTPYDDYCVMKPYTIVDYFRDLSVFGKGANITDNPSKKPDTTNSTSLILISKIHRIGPCSDSVLGVRISALPRCDTALILLAVLESDAFLTCPGFQKRGCVVHVFDAVRTD